MVFHRTLPPRVYADYRLYRSLLREDFHYRCAYCLRHEYFLGGEAGCCIDHHRPLHGPYARPDLHNDYANLYWCCRECNENKGDAWPDPDAYAHGRRFLDPCQPEDDHDLHLRIQPDGTIEPLTLPGRYTYQALKLWRDHLVYYRAGLYRRQTEVQEIRALLAEKALRPKQRRLLEAYLQELLLSLEPPVFDRPRG